MPGLAARPALTMRQEAVVEAVVQGKANTQVGIAKAAGVHRASVGNALQNAAVQREITRRKAEKADTALALLPRSLKRVASRLDEEEDVLRLTQVAVGMSKIIADGSEGTTAEAIGSSDHEKYQRQLVHAVRVGVAATLEGRMLPCAMDLYPEGLRKADSSIVQPSASCEADSASVTVQSSACVQMDLE